MFKRFSKEESISGQSAMKSSQQRQVRQKLVQQMPTFEKYIDDVLPKKEKGLMVRCAGHVTIVAREDGEPMFFQSRDGAFVPTLRTLHKYPFLLPVLRVDRGAIKHVMNGADVMVPGLRSERAVIEDEVGKGSVVAIFAESKQHAISVGFTKMSTADIRTADRGIAVENIHYIGDGLWKTPNLH
eukprot:IDg8607t1